ncbi:hypothetical protein OZX62_01930 [Bifidobacterium sp. ESL0690]|uniref:Ig-like domain-containing protein n=1 Tax=Bifidobacterium sp. ESL0690 TaxID=2983214 RepID=UPI0023F8A004|nr:Ig-like domain-containing protein [Bifidobacterium sp. ESL0690]WEV47077.1 hypothetical protein OZX62_01930 [Bifidobacterium sp. ESL0690]
MVKNKKGIRSVLTALIAITVGASAITPSVANASPSCIVNRSSISQCFPDRNLAMDVAYNAAGGNINNTFTQDVINRVTDLSTRDYDTLNLEGIQRLVNLQTLNLDYDKNIVNFNLIHQLPNLTELHLWNCGLWTVKNLAGMNNLRILELGYNHLSNVSKLSGLFNLTDLRLNNNALSNINNLNNLPNLQKINLDENNLSDITHLAIFNNLAEINASENHIRDISGLNNLWALKRMNMDSQNITLPSVGVNSSIQVRSATNINGTPVMPTSYGMDPDTGIYDPPTGIVTWPRPYVAGQVSFNFSGDVPLKGYDNRGSFSGKITQPYTIQVLNKSKLWAQVNSAKWLQYRNYTVGSWNVFAKALAYAKWALYSNTATQYQINLATKNLIGGKAGLRKRINKSALWAQVNDAKWLRSGNYTVGSWKVFAKALSYAKWALYANNSTQYQVNLAMKNLISGRAGLRKRVYSRSALWSQVNSAKKLRSWNYTSASWNVFSKSLSYANWALYGKATSYQIDLATRNLISAQAGLRSRW